MGAALGAAGTLVSGVTNMLGTQENAQATSQLDQYKAEMAYQNAIIEQRNANWSMEAGEVKVSNAGFATRAEVGQNKAYAGRGGVDIATGSIGNAIASERMIGVENGMTIQSNAAKEAYGHEVQAWSDINQGNMDEFASSQASEAASMAPLSLLGSALGAGGKLLG